MLLRYIHITLKPQSCSESDWSQRYRANVVQFHLLYHCENAACTPPQMASTVNGRLVLIN